MALQSWAANEPAPMPAVSAAIRVLTPAPRIALSASDPLTEAGLRRFVRASGGELSLVRDRDAADILLLAVDGQPARWIRDAVSRQRSGAPDTAVVVVVDVASGAPVPTAESVDADAVLRREALTGRALVDVSLTAAGRWVGPAEATSGTGDPDVPPQTTLSERERAVLRLLADGVDLAETARLLAYSERTVKNILYGLLARLELRNRVHAVAYAIRNGLI